MNPEDIPNEAHRWINERGAPFALIVAPHPFGQINFSEDDLEVVEEIVRAYRKIMSKRAKEKTKKKK